MDPHTTSVARLTRLGLTALGLGACTASAPLLPTAKTFDTGSGQDTAAPDDSGPSTDDTSDSGDWSDTGDTGDTGAVPIHPAESLEAWTIVSLDSDIWTALSVHEDTVWLATLYGKTTAFYDISNGLDDLGERIDTMAGEPVDGFVLTDISTVLMSDRVIVAASDPEQTGIVLGAYNLSGVPIIDPIQVVSDSPVPTNDMKLVLAGDELHLNYGADGYEKMVGVYNRDLSIIEAPRAVEDPSNGSQLGCVAPTPDGFVRVAGNYKNHGLVGVRYDRDWNTSAEDAFELPIPADTDEWIWFSSGCIQDPKTGDWYVAHQHMWNGDNADSQSSVELSRFDENWNHISTLSMTSRSGYTRPQLVLRGNDLFLSFDRGNGDVQVGWAQLNADR
ncbi:MAG TPA: hypothetical protein DFR83_10270 [Deltaproteobacteria bacterium]|nr:hypothetical protein [Deltaproteobacteria bacterium]